MLYALLVPVFLRWMLLSAGLLAFILLPFALWEAPLTAWSEQWLQPGAARGALFGGVVILLMLDVLLPIPSSFVAAGAVALLGAQLGALGIWLGMTLGAGLGYALGKWGGSALARRLVGASEVERAAVLLQRYGSGFLLASRGAPVLAEASALLAGALGMPALRFGVVIALGNAGLAFAYAAIALLALQGAAAVVAPFALGLLVPGVVLLGVRLLGRPR